MKKNNDLSNFFLKIQAAVFRMVLGDNTSVDDLQKPEILKAKTELLGRKLLETDPSLINDFVKMVEDPAYIQNPELLVEDLVAGYLDAVTAPEPTKFEAFQYMDYEPYDLEYGDLSGLGYAEIPISQPECICPNLLTGHLSTCQFKK